nr:unnamed protein product [Digitaria exilis]
MALVTIVVGVYQVIRPTGGRRPSSSTTSCCGRSSSSRTTYHPAMKQRESGAPSCVTPYESGEACSVLPACTHMFHKPCVAKWLRKRNTCPLCRATVLRPPAAVAAADDMV